MTQNVMRNNRPTAPADPPRRRWFWDGQRHVDVMLTKAEFDAWARGGEHWERAATKVHPIRAPHAPKYPGLYAALQALVADEQAGEIPKLTPEDLERIGAEHGVMDLREIVATLRHIAADAGAEAAELAVLFSERFGEAVGSAEHQS